jgi:hypothetical protein
MTDEVMLDRAEGIAVSVLNQPNVLNILLDQKLALIRARVATYTSV